MVRVVAVTITTDDVLLRIVRNQNEELGFGVHVVNWTVADDHQSLKVTAVDTLEDVTLPIEAGVQLTFSMVSSGMGT